MCISLLYFGFSISIWVNYDFERIQKKIGCRQKNARVFIDSMLHTHTHTFVGHIIYFVIVIYYIPRLETRWKNRKPIQTWIVRFNELNLSPKLIHSNYSVSNIGYMTTVQCTEIYTHLQSLTHLRDWYTTMMMMGGFELTCVYGRFHRWILFEMTHFKMANVHQIEHLWQSNVCILCTYSII